jgi:hypothetical protein
MMRASIEVGPERLLSKRGTIIPKAVNLGGGRILACYSVGRDVWFAPYGASLSTDNGATWQEVEPPMPRTESVGEIGEGHAIFFDQYLLAVDDGFVALYNETTDGGHTFSGPRPAHFALTNVHVTEYQPATDPEHAWHQPAVPPIYEKITGSDVVRVGGYIFGRILRLPDGALGVAAYCQCTDGMRRPVSDMPDHGYIPDDGVAEEASEDVLFSALFFRSEDGGSTWQQAGAIGEMAPGQPFDAGRLYSEGFTETGLAVTADRELLAVMRHGSYMLLWQNRSRDGGCTWDDMMCFNHPGVAPSLCLLPNGALAAAWGRPGMVVGFSLDGAGRNWDVMSTIMLDDQQSQKYPWLMPLDDSSVLLLYDRRVWDGERHQYSSHGIYCRTVRVSAAAESSLTTA